MEGSRTISWRKEAIEEPLFGIKWLSYADTFKDSDISPIREGYRALTGSVHHAENTVATLESLRVTLGFWRVTLSVWRNELSTWEDGMY